jgi:predicted nucleic acid-binding protein
MNTTDKTIQYVLGQETNSMPDMEIVSITPALSRASWKVKDKYRYSYWDSMIIASALDSKCSILYSEDMQHGQVIDKDLIILNPFK